MGKLLAVWKVVRPILGKITDVLLIGRQNGWWSKGPGVDEVFRDELRK